MSPIKGEVEGCGTGVLRVLLVLVISAMTVSGLSAQTEWDKSSITLDGRCETVGGFTEAVFSVANTGADMAGETDWREYEADALRTGGTFILAAGEVREWRFSPEPVGAAVRFEADQRPGHPGSSAPKLTLTCEIPTAVHVAGLRAQGASLFARIMAWIGWR